MKKLKPCPFCGEKAMCRKRRVKMNEWIIGCDGTNGVSCHGYVWKSPVYFTKKEAVNAWNRRENNG